MLSAGQNRVVSILSNGVDTTWVCPVNLPAFLLTLPALFLERKIVGDGIDKFVRRLLCVPVGHPCCSLAIKHLLALRASLYLSHEILDYSLKQLTFFRPPV